MSDEAEMNNESNLPDGLKALESSLGRIALPDPKLDRDELMYQSGWAAAIASLDSREEHFAVSTRATTPRLAWPLATLVASAAAVLFGVMFLQQAMTDAEPTLVDGTIVKKTNEVAVSPASPDGSNDLSHEKEPASAFESMEESTDLVELVMAYPSSGKLDASFVLFDSTGSDDAQRVVPNADGDSIVQPVLKNRFEMMNELLRSDGTLGDSSLL
ncbi:MAG: hypothetical protein AB8B55_15860 [Mariniblastus sp.]